MRLRDKIAVITGASRGIGKEIALAYAREGATVVLASRKAEQLEATAQEVQAAGGRALAIPTHTGHADQCAALIDQTIIVNMASVAGLQPMPMLGLYSVTKAAVIMLTKALAQELALHHIRVNAIAPGVVRTRFAQALWENDQVRERIEASTPLGRLAEPVEVAEAAVYLASDGASYVTGHVLVVDGGGTISGIVL